MNNQANKSTKIEVADIFRNHAHNLTSLTKEQKKVINDIVSCRTAELGGHILEWMNAGIPKYHITLVETGIVQNVSPSRKNYG